MRNRMLIVALTLAAIVGFTQFAPAGPGDSEPLGPAPHAIIHAPATLLHGSTSCTVWVHSHHMDCNQWTSLVPSKSGFTQTSYTSYGMGSGSYDVKITYSMSAKLLKVGQTIYWTGNVYNYCDSQWYADSSSTYIN